MQVISFKKTVLLKRGIWLSAAALIVFAAAPAVLDGRVRQDPLPSVVAVAMIVALIGYFLRKTQIHRLADEVVDCESHLRVRKGRTESVIPFAVLGGAEVSSFSGMHRITVRLRQSTKLGSRIDFLPQASLWSNLAAIQRLATSLTERAEHMKRA